MTKKRGRDETQAAKERARAHRTAAYPGLTVQQLTMPAGFSADGKRMVSLQDVLAPEVPTLEFFQLSPEQQAELTAARIERQPHYKMGMVGAGVIDKKRAVAEVKAQSNIGAVLMEIEQRTIQLQKKKALGGQG